MGMELSDHQREALRALCDTVVPAIERDGDGDGFWARRATDMGVDAGIEQMLLALPDPAQRAGLAELLDALALQGIQRAPTQLSREQILRNTALVGSAAAAGVGALTGMTLFLAYGAPDPSTGRNPNWATFAYPGPLSSPPQRDRRELSPLDPAADETLEADAVVVGSGAGGAVIAAALAQRMRVIVLEAGDYRDESDFAQLELKAYQELFWRGGPTPTVDGNVTLQAGATLGGGTTVNWTNCLRTHPWVREQWAHEFGLEGVDGAEYDRHLDAVLDRLGANDACSDLNGPQQRLEEACRTLGLDFQRVVRNADPDRYDPVTAGYLGFGDQSGSKLSTVKTYLRDAIEAGADLVVRCRADRVLVEHGAAAGVEATYTAADGSPRRLTIRAPRVAVAAGALESPALLLRSGIGGPAVGDYLRLHPCTATFGVYRDDQEAFWGPPQAGLCDHYADTGDGYGFMIETAQYAPGLTASAVPWRSGEEHKQMMARVPKGATFISLTRDRGHGRVVLDERGESAPLYAVDDEVDVRNLRAGLAVQARLHEAAGAREIYSLATQLPRWQAGDDLEAFIAAAQRVPMRAGAQRLFSAHQMGTCRMGLDRATSVAGPFGELHDVRGVYVGDASAFPTSSGTNPMISIMALARRTAEAILGAELPSTRAAVAAR